MMPESDCDASTRRLRTDETLAYKINDQGEITGECKFSGGEKKQAFRWSDPILEDLSIPDDRSSQGWGSNAVGDVVGRVPSPSGMKAYLWKVNGDEVLLGSLGNGEQPSQAFGINDQGIIVGSSHVNMNNRNRGFLWRDGVMKNLSKPYHERGVTSSLAWAVNNQNQIIGSMSHHTVEGHTNAVIWQPGKGVESLNALLPPHNGWWIQSATDINAHGQICGWGFDNIRKPQYETQSFLLTPVEPEMNLSIPEGPLRAGAVNTFEITTTEPNAALKFFYGKRGGGKFVPGCDALAAVLQIADLVLFGEAVADEAGNAQLEIFIPARVATHKGFLIQAVDFANCQESRLRLKKVE